MQYRAIRFDYGGVIHGMPGPLFNQAVATMLNLPVDDVMKEYFARNHQANIGTISFDDVWQQVFKALGRIDQFDDFSKFQVDWEKKKVLNPEVLELSDQLRSAGYKTGVLSNANAVMAEQVRRGRIDTHFDVYLPSCELGLMKPDPRAYRAFAVALAVEPRELIFVDDTPRSLESADEVGYTPVLYKNSTDLVKKLKSFGLAI